MHYISRTWYVGGKAQRIPLSTAFRDRRISGMLSGCRITHAAGFREVATSSPCTSDGGAETVKTQGRL
jgi:hypothetical protein